MRVGQGSELLPGAQQAVFFARQCDLIFGTAWGGDLLTSGGAAYAVSIFDDLRRFGNSFAI